MALLAFFAFIYKLKLKYCVAFILLSLWHTHWELLLQLAMTLFVSFVIIKHCDYITLHSVIKLRFSYFFLLFTKIIYFSHLTCKRLHAVVHMCRSSLTFVQRRKYSSFYQLMASASSCCCCCCFCTWPRLYQCSLGHCNR